LFGDYATAASATFINDPGMVSGALGGLTGFGGNATAANGIFINNGSTVSGAGGGLTGFVNNSTAGNSTLIANSGTNGGLGGTIVFSMNSTGGTARVETFGNGSLDISEHLSAREGVTVGSIEGDGNVFLGANTLKVGSNNLSTTFSGVIQDAGWGGGSGGSLTKIGTGTLTLSGTNTYTGNTNVSGGVLQINGSITSNTFVHGSRLAGTGTVYGSVTNNRAGRVSPGTLGVPGTLTAVHNYTQAQYATLMIQIAGANAGQFSVLNVLGNANLNGNLAPVLLNGFVPDIGQSFTFLNYASFTGAFSQIQHEVFSHGTLQWSLIYQNTNAILTVEPHTPGVPDHGSTCVLLTLGLFGLVMYRRQLLRG
jgi:autotransporter-associated beta strand protein